MYTPAELFPDLEDHKQGREVVVVCNNYVGAALAKPCEHDTDNEACHLARAANIVQSDVFKMKLACQLHSWH